MTLLIIQFKSHQAAQYLWQQFLDKKQEHFVRTRAIYVCIKVATVLKRRARRLGGIDKQFLNKIRRDFTLRALCTTETIQERCRTMIAGFLHVTHDISTLATNLNGLVASIKFMHRRLRDGIATKRGKADVIETYWF
jgi:hypothetical protein